MQKRVNLVDLGENAAKITCKGPLWCYIAFVKVGKCWDMLVNILAKRLQTVAQRFKLGAVQKWVTFVILEDAAKLVFNRFKLTCRKRLRYDRIWALQSCACSFPIGSLPSSRSTPQITVRKAHEKWSDGRKTALKNVEKLLWKRKRSWREAPQAALKPWAVKKGIQTLYL